MAKFCTKCGKPLVDGRPCSCSKEDEEVKEKINNKEEQEEDKKVKIKKEEKKNKVIEKVVEEDEEDKETDSNASSMINDILNIIKGLFKRPVKTIEKYNGIEYFNIAIGSIAINAVLFGFVINAFLDNCLKKLGYSLSTVQTFINQAVSELSSLGININVDTNFWLKGFIAMLVASALIVGIMYLVHTQVFKKKLNVKRIVVLVGVCELLLSVGFLVTIIASYIHYILALIIFTLFGIMFFIQLQQGFMQLSKLDKDKSFYTYLLSVIIPIIGFVVVVVFAIFISIIILTYSAYVAQYANIKSSIGY